MTTVDAAATLSIPVRARDVMSAPVLTVSPTTSVWDAWRLMMDSGLRHLVVCEDGRCVGIVDDRAVFAQWPMGPLALRRGQVGGIMRHAARRVVGDTPLHAVAELMVAEGVDAVPVVTDAGSLIGIVTTTDLTAAIAVRGMWQPVSPNDDEA